MLNIRLVEPFPISAPGRLSQFSDLDDYERPDLAEGVDIIVMGVNSIDWWTPDGTGTLRDSVLEALVESYQGKVIDTWVEYCPQSGSTNGQIVQCNLRELDEQHFELLLEKVGESLVIFGDRRYTMAKKINEKENQA
jgi:hypothetical protein